MFCPKCSEPKANGETRFCTKCGLDLENLSLTYESGNYGRSKRRDGIKQGVILIAIGIVLIPVWMFIGPAFPANDRLVESSPSTTWIEQIAWILMWVSYLAGAARIAFAFAFEDTGGSQTSRDAQRAFQSVNHNHALPDGEAFRPAEPGRWKTTDELLEPVLIKTKTSGELR